MDAKKVSDEYKMDMMQGCNHGGYFHTGIGKEGFSPIQNANRHDIEVSGFPRTGAHYTTGGAILKDCTKYKQQLAKLESLLRDLEWRGGDYHDYCPICYKTKLAGHDANCRLNNLLKTIDKP